MKSELPLYHSHPKYAWSMVVSRLLFSLKHVVRAGIKNIKISRSCPQVPWILKLFVWSAKFHHKFETHHHFAVRISSIF